ncbi:hypothetical protein JNUCC42_15170 [Brevibacterium sp. JNUCC-42]|nr:hypothetical protein JNUCC42_15170 [Brevibacterium sp. JNUCC-42]
MKKFAITLATSLSLLSLVSSSFPLNALASSPVEYMEAKGEDGHEIRINIPEKFKKLVTQEQINAIVEQAGDADEITIHNVRNNQDSKDQGKFKAMGFKSPVKYVESSDNPTKAVQILSVPRGKTLKLTKSEANKVSGQTRVKASVSAGSGTPVSAMDEVEASLTSEVSTTYTVEETFTGPEDAKYISRIYYWTGFFDRGTWRIDETSWWNGQVTATYKGDYTEPTHDVEWSRDFK